MDDKSDLAALTADVVSAYVANNPVPASELPQLIAGVHSALSAASAGAAEEPEVAQKPAVPVRRSVQDEAISCLECGKAYKSLRRHLRTHHDLTPGAYRQKWRLSADYPMVAPNYAAARSKLAKKMGLGRQR